MCIYENYGPLYYDIVWSGTYVVELPNVFKEPADSSITIETINRISDIL